MQANTPDTSPQNASIDENRFTERVGEGAKAAVMKARSTWENVDREKALATAKGAWATFSLYARKIYVIDFLFRLFRKSNTGTIAFLVLNIGLYIAIFGGFTMPEMIPTAIALYLISLTIALSPIGEFIVRIQSGCKPLTRWKDKAQAERIQRLFDEIYGNASRTDPLLSNKIKPFLSRDEDANAFATGRRSICVTQGLLELDDDEIRGVLAHEFGHISHKDTDLLLVILVSNLLLGGLFLVIRMLASIIIWMIGEGERSLAGLGNLIVRILVDMILVTLMRLWTKLGVLLVMHASRQNEYEADQYACRLGYGSALVVALEILDGEGGRKGFWANLRCSHPDTVLRMERLHQWLDTGSSETPGAVVMASITGTSMPKPASLTPEPVSSMKRAAVPTPPASFVVQTSAPTLPASFVVQTPASTPPATSSSRTTDPAPLPQTSSLNVVKPIPFRRTESPAIADGCYGRFSEDGRMYYGQVLAIEEGYADFLFFDGVREWVPEHCLISIRDAWSQLKMLGNRRKSGQYHACTIERNLPDGKAAVRFHQDGSTETLTCKDFMMICPPNF